MERVCPGLLFSHRRVAESRIVLPVGSFEDHIDLPVIFDTLLALEAACRASRLCGILVAWPLGYGFSPEHEWSVSLGEDDIARLAAHVVKSLKRRGVREVVVVDGHYGHSLAIRKAVEAAGARYVNVWKVFEKKGVKGFRAQLVLEQRLYRGEDTGLLDTVAEEICSD